MTNKEAEQKIKRAFSNAVPNMRDSILSDCQNQKGAVTIMTDHKRKNPWPKRLAGIAAAFVLLIGGMAGFQVYQANYTVASLISLDVNPSIEIQVNEKEQVLAVDARNEDAKVVVGDMNFKGSSLDVTINALIGSMLRNGYLNEMANSILVSVDNHDPVKGAKLQERLVAEINEVLQTDTFSGAILSQTISADSNLRTLADTYGITLGKAQLIQQIIGQNTIYSFEDLVPLSINELNLLSESSHLELANVNSMGTASDKAYLGEEKAKETALSHAKLSSDRIMHYEIELDYENGMMVYEISFDCEGFEYDYEIDALTGAILKNEKKPDDDYIPPQNSTEENAESTGNTGNTGNTGSADSAGNSGNAGSANNAGNSGNTGTTNNTSGSDNSSVNTQPDSSASYISEAKAKEAALAHACVTADSVTGFQCKLDHEDGHMVYEINFRCGAYEYDYEIDASSGAIRKHEKDCDDDYYEEHHTDSHHGDIHHSSGGTTSSRIGKAQAKKIALSHAGVNANNIQGYQCELDSEDGVTVYEIEFDCAGYEYSYEINAIDGAIVKSEKEADD